MPANLPPQYYELERDFKSERDPREKLRLAKELLAMMPKHKGTDKLQAEMKAKISKLTKQIEGTQKSHGAKTVETFDHIPREGAAQVILIGPPNTGKSSLVDALTSARVVIGDYPFSTREPVAGMMKYETIQIQLIDTPPISHEYCESFVFPLIRQADLAVIVADASDPNLIKAVEIMFVILDEKRIRIAPRIDTHLEDPRMTYKRGIIAAHKCLEERGPAGLEELEANLSEYKIFPTSILDDQSMERFRKGIFDSLGIIRVYTKPVGREADFNDPIILPVGGTVEDAALSLHKDFAQKLQFARIWGTGKFEGQRVKNNYELSDGDIIEFHI
jgi:ribosome-interacting GTPase 1